MSEGDELATHIENQPPTLTVVVPTYSRPGVLSLCLTGVLEHIAQVERDGLAREVQLLVVDNDPDGSAREEVRSRGDRVRYVCEPIPGIAAARARALDEVDSRLLSFIDDDEVPLDGWLDSLLKTWQSTGATAISGRVDSIFDGPVHRWITADDLFGRPRFATGTTMHAAAAGNLLLDAAWVRAHGLTFDARLGLGGGEDSLFTKQLVAAGGTIVWCDESVADDRVPAARMNRRWLARRFFSQGHATVVVELLLLPHRALSIRARAGVGGAARSAAGAVWFAWGVLRRSDRDKALAMRLVSRGAGMVSAMMGARHQEYRRPVTKSPVVGGS
jgi:Glycosyl transferase family 2